MDIKLSDQANCIKEGENVVVKNAFTHNGISYDIVVSSQDTDLSKKHLPPDLANRIANAWKTTVGQMARHRPGTLVSPDGVQFNLVDRAQTKNLTYIVKASRAQHTLNKKDNPILTRFFKLKNLFERTVLAPHWHIAT